MSAIDIIAVLIVVGAAPAATLHPILYVLREFDGRSLLGWGLLTYLLGMGSLIDISLAYQFFGDDYPGRDFVRLAVYALIFVGSWLLFIGYLRTKRDH